MDEKTRLALATFGAALVLGSLGDLLLRSTPWGLNVFLWTVALVVAAVALARLWNVGISGEGRWFLPVAALFAAGVVWRDSMTVAFLDVVAALIALSLAALWGRSGRVRLRGLSEYVIGGLYTGAVSAAGPLPAAVRDVRWAEVTRGRRRGHVLAVARGVTIAVPLLFVFGALFVAADAVFENFVIEVFDIDLVEIFGHLFLIGFFAWTSAGLLWLFLLSREPEGFSFRRPGAVSLGIVEIGIALGLLDLLFAAFVFVQVRYLFGGAETVVTSAGLTYAEYARRGFFELVTVTALALPVLLLAHWLLRGEERTHRRIFVAFAGAMVGLLFVVVASALYRMRLYTGEFGLTELRFYTTAFMFWISAVLLWFLPTVLRGRRDRFAFGALVTGFAAILIINAINPDALIARTNIARLEEGKRFDAYYLTTLSADAAPVLSDALPGIGDRRLAPEYERTMPSGEEKSVEGPTLERELLDRWDAGNTDWRTWNLGRWRADRIAGNYE